jgi:hypothetical protein
VEACNHSGGRAEIHFRGRRRGTPANASAFSFHHLSDAPDSDDTAYVRL